MNLIIILALFLTDRIFVHATVVDNGVIDDPEVQCNADSVALNFKTIRSFEGHIYVKGHYEDAGCRQDESNSIATIFNVSFNACGVRRQRSANPPGIFITTTIVISFHPMFITKVDRAYAVRCFYMAADKTVTADLNVRHHELGVESLGVVNDGHKQGGLSDSIESQLTTYLITQNIPMPVCRYEVLEANSNGQLVRYAVVGQLVYHKWTCEGEYASFFCMTVHSCLADDGHGKRFPLLDESGCAQDRYLMENLNYTDDMSGGVESHVFKYADKPSLFFQCQIRLTVKDEDKVCRRTSEHCPALYRGKRAAATAPNGAFFGLKNLTSFNTHYEDLNKPYLNTDSNSMDVFTDPMVVIDVDDGQSISLGQLGQHDDSKLSGSLQPGYEGSFSLANRQKFCLSTVTFGAMLSAFTLMMFVLLISSMAICLRKKVVAEFKH